MPIQQYVDLDSDSDSDPDATADRSRPGPTDSDSDPDLDPHRPAAASAVVERDRPDATATHRGATGAPLTFDPFCTIRCRNLVDAANWSTPDPGRVGLSTPLPLPTPTPTPTPTSTAIGVATPRRRTSR
jgi:hypothetical protein